MTNSIYKTHKPGGTDNLYLKLKDGDKVKLRISSSPAVSTYDGTKLRYNWIVWNRELNKPQVYNAGISVFSQIAELVEEWGEPNEYDITIKRTGATMNDTEYFVTPVKESVSLTKVQEAEATKIDLPLACKGKWLFEFERDGKLPEAIKPESSVDEIAPMPSGDEPILLSDIPF